MRDFEGISNEPENFEYLFSSHENYSFSENLERLVGATNNIQPIGKKFMPDENQVACIVNSVERAQKFLRSKEYEILNNDLNKRVSTVTQELLCLKYIHQTNSEIMKENLKISTQKLT